MKDGLETRISHVLKSRFDPAAMKVANTSNRHLGHREVAGSTSLETHFHVWLRSAAFNGMVSACSVI